MTKVKKTKKPKARKAVKKPVTKIGASVRKIDKRLRPTPQPKIESIDKRIKKPILISDIPRSLLPQNQLPLRMFSGQDTGAILSKQLDVLASKEQQLEGKVTQLQKQNLYEQIIGKMSIIDSNLNILDKNYEDKEYNRLNKQLKEINRLIPKDEPTLFDFYDNLYDKLRNIKNENKMDVFVSDEDLAFLEQTTFKEVKSTNTLLDDVIHNNNLVDEAEIIMEEIRSKEIKRPVTLPNLEQAFLLGEIKGTEIKGPITLPTFEEAVSVVKKSRGRPKKEKINELVEVKSTNTLLDDVIVDNILDDVYDPQASTRRRQEIVNQARLEREQAERAFDEKMRLNSLRISEEVREAKEQRGMKEEDEPYQTAMWRIVGTTKKRSDLLP
jgi:hypothetical protein